MLGVYSLARIQSQRQLCKIAALAAIFCLSLVCGNASLRFLPVSFTQVRAGRQACAAGCQTACSAPPVVPAGHWCYHSLLHCHPGAAAGWHTRSRDRVCDLGTSGCGCVLARSLSALAEGSQQHHRHVCHAGIAVATRAEPSFHLLGFGLAMGATCSRALKSIVQVLDSPVMACLPACSQASPKHSLPAACSCSSEMVNEMSMRGPACRGCCWRTMKSWTA